jgi:hypothetical protein
MYVIVDKNNKLLHKETDRAEARSIAFWCGGKVKLEADWKKGG